MGLFAQLDLALDVHDTGFAQKGAGSNANGKGELGVSAVGQ